MPMLGDILAAARRSAPAVERWLAEAEPDLLARLRAAAAAGHETPAAYLRVAVADFGRFATEEDWATLMSRLRTGPEPGTTCLLAMLEWRLAAATPVPDRSEGLAR
ncbi:MAG TPA: hypothetical protein VFN28_06635 [Amaricoccus sp.]|nr:hypothetical protein [Amaricoccus sp.]